MVLRRPRLCRNDLGDFKGERGMALGVLEVVLVVVSVLLLVMLVVALMLILVSSFGGL